MVLAELRCQLDLGQSRLFSFLDKQRDQSFVPIRAKCIDHLLPQSEFRWGVPLYLIFSYLKFRYFSVLSVFASTDHAEAVLELG